MRPLKQFFLMFTWKDMLGKAACADSKFVAASVVGEGTEWENEQVAMKCFVHNSDGIFIYIIYSLSIIISKICGLNN